MNEAFTTRPYQVDLGDDNLVAASFFQAWRQGGKGPNVAFSVYHPGAARHIQRLMGRSVIVVAHVRDVPSEIAGWSMFEPDVLHFVYVKKPYRGQGIGRFLSTLQPFTYHSHETRKFKPTTQFNPFLAEAP